MNYPSLNSIAMTTLEDLLRPKETGEQVISHVLREAKQPAPDFEAMRRAISDLPLTRNAKSEEEDVDRALP